MRWRALLLVGCLLLAGCNTPSVGGGVGSPTTDTTTVTPDGQDSTATGSETENDGATTTPATTTTTTATSATTTTPTTTPTPDSPAELAATYDISVEGSFPANVSLVFARVAFLVDRPGVTPPETVQVRSDTAMQTGSLRYPQFFRLLGVEPTDESVTLPAYVATPRRIVVSRNLTERGSLAEATLAQEAAHVIQFREGADDTLQTTVVTGRPTVENNYLLRSVIEGGAVYTEAVYQRRYLDANRTRIDSLRASYRNQSDIARISFGLYYFGARYVERRVDSPGETWEIYENPPRTTEELLHNLPPGSEPVADLTVTDAADDGWESRPRQATSYGELFLRGTLATSLNESVAARGADGWGNDRRLVFENDSTGESGYAWALRWDDTANATEFERVFGTYLNRTANRTTLSVGGETVRGWRTENATYRLLRVSDRTTVLLVGSEQFVGNASVTGDGGDVTVRVESE